MTSSSTFSVRAMIVDTIRKSITPVENTRATAGSTPKQAYLAENHTENLPTS